MEGDNRGLCFFLGAIFGLNEPERDQAEAFFSSLFSSVKELRNEFDGVPGYIG